MSMDDMYVEVEETYTEVEKTDMLDKLIRRYAVSKLFLRDVSITQDKYDMQRLIGQAKTEEELMAVVLVAFRRWAGLGRSTRKLWTVLSNPLALERLERVQSIPAFEGDKHWHAMMDMWVKECLRYDSLKLQEGLRYSALLESFNRWLTARNHKITNMKRFSPLLLKYLETAKEENVRKFEKCLITTERGRKAKGLRKVRLLMHI